MITLYDFELFAPCYAVRLGLAFMGIPHQVVALDAYPGRDTEAAWFRRLSPSGALPALREGDTVLHDAAAILVYVAARHAPAWYPAQPWAMGEIQQWLGFAAALTASAGAARLHEGFNIHTEIAAARDEAHRLLRRLDAHLWFAEQQERRWLCAAPAPSIADIACFPDIMLAEEGGVMLHEYPAIRRWCDRMKRLPGFIAMPGVFPAGAAAYTV